MDGTLQMVGTPPWERLVERVVTVKRRCLRELALRLALPDPEAPGEAARIAAIKASAAVPERCGGEIKPAYARGRLVVFEPMGMVPKGKAGYQRSHVGWAGRDAARAADAFDAMASAARRARAEPPFTPYQVAAGRAYGALVERYEASGLQGISVEVMMAGRGAGGGGGYADAVLAQGRRLKALWAAIGTGFALEVERPSPTRRPIRVRNLVDGVCIGGQTLGAVLEGHGWRPHGEVRARLREALAEALDRMAHVAGIEAVDS